MREAMFYARTANAHVHCELCFRQCRIAPGKRGFCGVRENKDGTLYTLNYGLAVAAAIDPVEKKPLYRFMPRTNTYSFAAAGCNLACPWCQNHTIACVAHNAPVPGRPMTSQEHVGNALRARAPSIACTYTEPTVYIEYALETMRLAKESGLKTIWVSNGMMSASALAALLPDLDAVNIDYKAAEDATYQSTSGGCVDCVKDNMIRIKRAGVHLEVTTLLVPGVNDAPDAIRTMAEFIVEHLGAATPWHLSRFFPHHRATYLRPTPLETIQTACGIARKVGLEHVHPGNV